MTDTCKALEAEAARLEALGMPNTAKWIRFMIEIEEARPGRSLLGDLLDTFLANASAMPESLAKDNLTMASMEAMMGIRYADAKKSYEDGRYDFPDASEDPASEPGSKTKH